MTINGGLRARLIRESMFEMLESSLTTLGWFDPTRPHLPISFVSRAYNQDETIPLNSAALSDEGMTGTDIELGSLLSEDRWLMYVDFFADSDALGLHFTRDVADILKGRMPSIGRDDPSFIAYDLRQATPPAFTVCQIENVVCDRAHGFLKPWLEHWYAVQFWVVDTYGNEGS